MTPENMRAYLKRRGISQYELSREMGVTPESIKAFLSGKNPIPRVFEFALDELERRWSNGEVE